jgi:hypothetical protein
MDFNGDPHCVILRVPVWKVFMPSLVGERRFENPEEHVPVTSAPPSRNPIPDAVYDKVFRSPSIFGRIVLVAALRNPLAGGKDASFPAPYLASTSEQALRDLHLDVFSAWLLHPLRRQMADINIYMNRSGFTDVRQLAALGERSLPPEADRNDRELFLHDLKIIEVLLANRVE